VGVATDTVAESVHRISVDRYHRMVEAGVFEPDEAVELLEGVIVSMPPEGPDHAGAVQVLNRLFTRAAADRHWVRIQSPLTLPGVQSEPEPDLALIEGGFDPHGGSHPSSAELVVEVSHSSVVKDRTWKTRVYATAGVPEYWIVNLAKRQLEVHRDPDTDEGRYRSLVTLRSGDRVRPSRLPELEIAVGDVVG
jgi:Uma2 family endonuclease